MCGVAAGAAAPPCWGRTVAGWLRRGAASLLAAGPLPRHVAFIMDGNRRFADRLHLGRAGGHSRGYDKLVQALEWCLELGVPCVSVYAFSLENFNRSGDEVAVLMDLAEQKLLAILQERDIIERHSVRVQVLGDLSRLPPAVAAAARSCMAATAHQTRCTLNICLAYTSTQEMWQALTAVQEQLRRRQLSPQDASVELLHQHLYTKGCPLVDLMIRTSGETRLSDFLLPQSGHATLHFSAALWPDFSFLDMLAALAQFQQQAPTLAAMSAAAAGSGGSCSSGPQADNLQAAQRAVSPSMLPAAAAAASADCLHRKRHCLSGASSASGADGRLSCDLNGSAASVPELAEADSSDSRASSDGTPADGEDGPVIALSAPALAATVLQQRQSSSVQGAHESLRDGRAPPMLNVHRS